MQSVPRYLSSKLYASQFDLQEATTTDAAHSNAATPRTAIAAEGGCPVSNKCSDSPVSRGIPIVLLLVIRSDGSSLGPRRVPSAC